MGSASRVACEGRFCLWRIVEELGPCAAYRCSNEWMYLTDRSGRTLGATLSLARTGEVSLRFLDPTHVELLFWDDAQRMFPPVIDNGVDSTRAERSLLEVSQDGKKFTSVASPGREGTQPVAPTEGPKVALPKPLPRMPVGKKLLARARALCPSEEPLHPRDYVCRDGTCLLVLAQEEEAREAESSINPPFCFLQVTGGNLRPVAISTDATLVAIRPFEYVFSAGLGPYGSYEEVEAISRLHPGRMSFVDTTGLHVQGASRYPVREAKTVEAARGIAPTVHASTPVHIPWGQKTWRDSDDLSLAWQLFRVGKTLRLHVEVLDDQVVPLGEAAGIHSDHLELSVAAHDAHGNASEPRKLGILLAADGKVETRRWTKSEDLPTASAHGTWQRTERGYTVDLTLPVEVSEGQESPRTAHVSVMVSDADARKRQETLMGHSGTLHFWKEYPPTIDEYRTHP
ncbi:hypothetical protein ACN469_35350 [Corallococcus terminator]